MLALGGQCVAVVVGSYSFPTRFTSGQDLGMQLKVLNLRRIRYAPLLSCQWSMITPTNLNNNQLALIMQGYG